MSNDKERRINHPGQTETSRDHDGERGGQPPHVDRLKWLGEPEGQPRQHEERCSHHLARAHRRSGRLVWPILIDALLIGVFWNVFFGVRFLGAASFPSARDCIGLGNLVKMMNNARRIAIVPPMNVANTIHIPMPVFAKGAENKEQTIIQKPICKKSQNGFCFFLSLLLEILCLVSRSNDSSKSKNNIQSNMVLSPAFCKGISFNI